MIWHLHTNGRSHAFARPSCRVSFCGSLRLDIVPVDSPKVYPCASCLRLTKGMEEMDGYDANKYEVQHLDGWLTPQVWGTHIKVRRWDGEDGIPWDDLQEIKNEIAGEEAVAIEIYPAAQDLVYEENIRHLWVVPPDFPLPNLRR